MRGHATQCVRQATVRNDARCGGEGHRGFHRHNLGLTGPSVTTPLGCRGYLTWVWPSTRSTRHRVSCKFMVSAFHIFHFFSFIFSNSSHMNQRCNGRLASFCSITQSARVQTPANVFCLAVVLALYLNLLRQFERHPFAQLLCAHGRQRSASRKGVLLHRERVVRTCCSVGAVDVVFGPVHIDESEPEFCWVHTGR